MTVLFVALLLGQQAPIPPQAPPVKYGPVPLQAPAEPSPVPKAKVAAPPSSEPTKPRYSQFPGYYEGMAQAIRTSKPLIIFNGVAARSVKGAIACEQPEKLDGYPFPSIIVGKPAAPNVNWQATLDGSATDAEIQAELQKGVTAITPSPFSEPKPASGPVVPDVDPTATGPWLSKKDQDYLHSLWPEGVPFPEGLVFYKLPAAAQNIKTLNNTEYWAFHRSYQSIASDAAGFPWETPGGLHWAPREEWRNVVGIRIPKGKPVNVWVETVQIPNSLGSTQPQPKLSWSFPDDTAFVDLLIRKGDPERVFEVRVREKHDGKWDEGTAYRPQPDGEEKEYKTSIPASYPVLQRALGQTEVKYTVIRVPRLLPIFRPALGRKVYVDDDLTPKDYVGTGMACNSCHARAGQIGSYASVGTRGGDFSVSWYPVIASEVTDGVIAPYYQPRLDYRWPIKFLGRF